MSGTIIITGANSSLAIPAVDYLLETYPSYTVVLTVRNTSAEDANTAKLLKVTSAHANSTIVLRTLDLASLAQVAAFADEMEGEIKAGKLPRIAAIICNAFFWGLSGGPQLSQDGYELSLAVGHLAHVSLMLRLLHVFSKDSASIVVLGSEVHWPGKNAPMEQFAPDIPTHLDDLVKPAAEAAQEAAGRGFQRYARAKLACIMCMYQLNRRLQEMPPLQHIAVKAVDPGSLVDSRAFQQADVPASWKLLIGGFLNRLQPILKLVKPTIRRARDAAPDVIELAVGPMYRGQQGYFIMRKPAASSPESNQMDIQELLFDKSLEWIGLSFEQVAAKASTAEF